MATTWLHAALLPARFLMGRRRARGWGGADPTEPPPLRAELFTADQMELHGERLAALHESALMREPDRLLPRLADNERALIGVCTLLAQAEGPQRRTTPAGEWLLDNLYLIEEEIRIATRHLPPGYSRELPRSRTGPSAGLPRAYDLAIESVAHGEGRLAGGTLTRFLLDDGRSHQVRVRTARSRRAAAVEGALE